MAKKIGVLTIGQAPRIDVVPELAPYWGENVDIIEAGALDGLSSAQIEELAPESGHQVLVSRLKDGSWVKLGEEKILPLLQGKIDLLHQEGVDLILLLCTGSFPRFQTRKLIIEPNKIIHGVVKGLIPIGGTLGVIVPDPDQVDPLIQIWQAVLGHDQVIAVPGSPYESIGQIHGAAQQLEIQQPDLIVLDCMGYNREMKKIVETITGKPVVLSRGLLARVVGEMVGE